MSDLKRRAEDRSAIPTSRDLHLECNGDPKCNGGLENPPSVDRDCKENSLMIDGKPYPLPETWTESSISEVVLKTKQRDPRKKPDEVFQYVDVSAVSNTSFKITSTAPTLGSDAPSRARKAIETDDVLFATVRPTLKRIALVPPELDGAIASTGYCVLRCDQTKVIPGFLYSFLITDHFIARIAGLERGASYPAVRDSDVMASWLPLPPLPEQKKIAHILLTVQQAIEAQERIIQTTTELKKALMHKLFTEGLCNEPQKETEIGLVPQSWEVVEIGHLTRIKGGKRLPKGEKLVDRNTGFPYIRVTDFNDFSVDVRGLLFLTEAVQRQISRYIINKDDVFISIAGSIGITGMIQSELDGANLTENAARLIVDDSSKLHPRFLMYWMASVHCQAEIIAQTVKNAQPKLALARIRALKIPIPSIEEQVELFRALDIAGHKMENARLKRDRFQDLFRNLLHQLMTAKIRVHKYQLKLQN